MFFFLASDSIFKLLRVEVEAFLPSWESDGAGVAWGKYGLRRAAVKEIFLAKR